MVDGQDGRPLSYTSTSFFVSLFFTDCTKGPSGPSLCYEFCYLNLLSHSRMSPPLVSQWHVPQAGFFYAWLSHANNLLQMSDAMLKQRWRANQVSSRWAWNWMKLKLRCYISTMITTFNVTKSGGIWIRQSRDALSVPPVQSAVTEWIICITWNNWTYFNIVFVVTKWQMWWL